MKLCLVNPPKSFSDVSDISPPLTLLRLADAAESIGWEPLIVDLNLLIHTDRVLRENFYERALDILLACQADTYGFTSMAVDSHIAIDLARQIKAERPDSKTIVGGVHFSAIHDSVASEYTWIDQTIIGQSTQGLTSFLAHNQQKESLRNAGATDRNKSIFRHVDISEYFSVNSRRAVDIEGGRGCRFKCSFCYSPTFHGSPVAFTVDSIISEMYDAQCSGAERVFFVQDNFSDLPDQAAHLCQRIISDRLRLRWNCYVTLPQTTEGLLSLMASAGCDSIFMGIDAVGDSTQSLLQKRFYNGSKHLANTLDICTQAGIVPTCAFMLAPPSLMSDSDFHKTVELAMYCRMAGANVRLNTLSYYQGTPLYESLPTRSFSPDNLKAELLLDVPPCVVDNPYALSKPHLFPFHNRTVGAREWNQFLQLTHCLWTLMACWDRLPVSADDTRAVIGLARGTLAELGNLVQIDKEARRQVEFDVACSMTPSYGDFS